MTLAQENTLEEIKKTQDSLEDKLEGEEELRKYIRWNSRGEPVFKYAPWSEVKNWFLLAAIIAAIMLLGVVVSGSLLAGGEVDGAQSQLLGEYGRYYYYHSDFSIHLEAIIRIFNKNMVVLLLHFFCCLVGAIIGREAYKKLKRPDSENNDDKPDDSIDLEIIDANAAADITNTQSPLAEDGSPGFFERWNHLPKWVADLALAYAATATLASIALQTTGIGFILSDMSAYTGLSAGKLGLLILPHAPLELIGVFLPLGLFLIQAKKHQLAPLGKWAVQSLLIAIPIILLAAIIEVYITPQLIEHAISSNGGLPE